MPGQISTQKPCAKPGGELPHQTTFITEIIIKYRTPIILTGCLSASLAAHANDQIPVDAHPQVSLSQALKLMEDRYPGEVQGIRLVQKDHILVYEVTVLENSASRQMLIDASTGTTLDKADSGNSADSGIPKDVPTTTPQASPGHWIALEHPSLYFNYSTGQLAGMNNTILKPKETIGTRFDVAFSSLPDLETHANIYGIYGTAQSSAGTSKSGLQEIRGEVSSIYDFYNQNQRSKAGIGVYSEFAVPVRNNLSYGQALPSSSEYSAEEGDRQKREFLYGVDLKIASQSERISSDLHNILFVGGTRIAPNLLTYKPLLGMMWHNDFYFLGNTRDPKLRFFTDVNMYFARKAGSAVFNSHDGIGGTKRELYISYGVGYSFNRQWELSLRSYGFNNLNRGNSAQTPTSFRDGFILSTEYKF